MQSSRSHSQLSMILPHGMNSLMVGVHGRSVVRVVFPFHLCTPPIPSPRLLCSPLRPISIQTTSSEQELSLWNPFTAPSSTWTGSRCDKNRFWPLEGAMIIQINNNINNSSPLFEPLPSAFVTKQRVSSHCILMILLECAVTIQLSSYMRCFSEATSLIHFDTYRICEASPRPPNWIIFFFRLIFNQILPGLWSFNTRSGFTSRLVPWHCE